MRRMFAPLIVVSAAAALSAAPPAVPHLPWGDPDLEGVWTYATMTPLERPRDLAAKSVLTDAEAAMRNADSTRGRSSLRAACFPSSGIRRRSPASRETCSGP